MTATNNIVVKYLFEARAELAKVVWPSREQIITHALLVIGISLLVGAYFGLVDFLLSKGLESVITLTQ